MGSRFRCALTAAVVLVTGIRATPAAAVLTTFFDSSQSCSWTYAPHFDTMISQGYSFTRTMDKDFSPTGRYEQIYWPAGLHVQAITAGPAAPTSPQLTLTRADGDPFDLRDFSIKLLGNTYGAGGAIEIQPILNGVDGAQVTLDATGYYGQVFNYHPNLIGYDTYKMSIYVDFALTSATVDGAPIPEPGAAGAVLGAGLLVLAAARPFRRRGTIHRGA
jgi:hypothetical protein